jgi:glycosyltransferase involved in cell wall biosynthesis
MTGRQKLLVLTSTFPRWQGDTIVPFVYELSQRLTEDFEVSVLTPSYPGAKADEIIGQIKVHRFRYFIRRFEKLAGGAGILPTLKKNKWHYLLIPFFMTAYFFALRKQIRKQKPSVIHAHWIVPQGFIAALTKKLYKVPFLVTAHGGDVFGLQGRFATAIKRFTLKNATKITVVSTAIREKILADIAANFAIEVISMGVDSERFNPEMKDSSIKNKYAIDGPFLLFVGRLTEKKGIRFLIEAMPTVIREFPKAKLMIVGTGLLESELKALVQKLNLQQNIIFAGQIANSDLPKYYATTDAFVAPSIITKDGDREGLPVTLMEAMSCGAITVATDLEGNRDLISNGQTGFLIKQKRPAEISKTIIELLTDDYLTWRIRKQAREKIISAFDWKIVSNKYKKALST